MFETVLQRLHQEHAVGKPRQRIVMGHMFQLLRHVADLPEPSTFQNGLPQGFDGGGHVADLVPSILKRRDDIGFLTGDPECRLHQRRNGFQKMPGNQRHENAGDGQNNDQGDERIVDELALRAIKRVRTADADGDRANRFFRFRADDRQQADIMAGIANRRKAGGKTRGDRISGEDGIGGNRFFGVVGGVVEGRRDLTESGIGLVVAEKPDGILGLRTDEGENVAGVEAGNEDGSVVANRLVGQDAVHLSVRVGGDADIGIDAAQGGAGNL